MAQFSKHNFVFSFLHQVSTWHCSHSLLRTSRAAIIRYLLPARPTAANPVLWRTRPNDGTDRQTDTQQYYRPCFKSYVSSANEGNKKGSTYSTTERRVPELIPILGSQPAGVVSHKPGGRLPLLSARPAVTPATLKRAATNFAAWWTEAQWVWAVCLRLLPDSVVTAIWTRALLHLSPAC